VKIKSTAAVRHFRARKFVSACCSQEDVMIQIGIQPLPPAFAEGPPADPADVTGRKAGTGPRLAGAPSADTEDQTLYVSPPPLPFPRVFPGL
jgi:hypothetical protein